MSTNEWDEAIERVRRKSRRTRENESKVVRALQEISAGTATQIAAKAAISVGKVRSALVRLRAYGRVRRLDNTWSLR